MPHLPVESIAAANSSPERACAVIEGQRVIDVDAVAQAAGVRPGHSVPAASLLLPGLQFMPRDLLAERQMLEALADCASAHTPRIVLAGPAQMLLELHGSLRLFGGLEAIVRRLHDMIVRLGLRAHLASAPNARAALWLAAVHEEIHPVDNEWQQALGCLPLSALRIDDTISDEQTFTTLGLIGARTVADLVDLPRAGFTRRFGADLLTRLDEARGCRATAHAFFVPAERFTARSELTHAVDDAAILLFAARRLLVQLEAFLLARAAATDRIRLELRHDEGPATVLIIEMGLARRSAEHFALLTREHLERLSLRAPVVLIAIEVSDLCRMPEPSQSLFPDAPGIAQDIDRLVDRLQARLGPAAVQAVQAGDDHRPEQASLNTPWRQRDWREQAQGTLMAAGRRPVWLLHEPRPLREVDNRLYPDRQSGFDSQTPLRLLTGPERIESGWWDGADVLRDYFLAASADHALLWIYRSRSVDAHWFLHGVFA